MPPALFMEKHFVTCSLSGDGDRRLAEDFLEQLVKCVAMGYKEEEYFCMDQ